jgi:hypothetical protein
MRKFAIFLVLLTALVSSLPAQTTSGTLRGRVTDPSGAVIPKATVSATGANGKTATSTSNGQGIYELKGLAPGDYNVTATAPGFAVDQEPAVSVKAGQVQPFDIGLQIAVEQQKVEVQEDAPTVSVSPENNASTLVLKGKDLDALSDDPDELSDELQALAGPSAGPNGGQIYVDGFTAGQLPPKSAIREIRINQNPFSAQYDKLGYGRIEIFTKPGTDKLHGQVMVNGNSFAFNSLNPFVTEEPPYNTELYNGSVSGALSKKMSFTFDVQQRDIGNQSVVVAQVLDPSFNAVPFNQSVPSPRTRLNLTPRMDFQLSPNNTLTIRYQYEHETQNNDGIGGFSLPSTGYNALNTEQTVQISDTQIISPTIVNETRFQYIRDTDDQTPLSIDPTLNVLGAFTGGGSMQGTNNDKQDHYELQNYTSMTKGHHFIKFGARLRGTLDSSYTNSNFNGAFTFPSLNAYQITELGLSEGMTPAQIRAAGGGASQFSITTGQPLSDVSMVDVGLYAEDEWHFRPNLTFNYGLRYETQSAIAYHGDWAPRFSVAWGLGHSAQPKTVLRAGWGIFYDRFSYNDVLQAERLNGSTQEQYIVVNPDFYPQIPPVSSLQQIGKASPTTYQIAPGLQPPSILQTAVSLERQITKTATLSLTYLNSRGEHQLFLRNANAPLPGTYNPADPNSGVRPFGGNGNIYQYNTEGIFRQNQLIANFRVNVGKKLSLFGFYSLNFSNSDLGAGAGSAGGAFFGGGGGAPQFVMNSYDPMQDYGRAAFDIRNRLFVGGTIYMPYGLRLNPFILANSGAPFNIVVGQDLNGDSIFNDRPALANTAGPGGRVIVTPYGTFNTVPLPGQPIVPINYGSGPALFSLNLRLSKTVGFGPKVRAGNVGGDRGPGGGGGGGRGGGLGPRGLAGGGGGNPLGSAESNHRYNMTFSINARNLLNNVNYAPPVGNLDSPLFGTSNALAGGPFSNGSANRRIDLQLVFAF